MPCAQIAHESSTSLLFSFPRSGREYYSDALLPTRLTVPLRTFAAISVTLIVRCGVQFAWGSWKLFELLSGTSSRIARARDGGWGAWIRIGANLLKHSSRPPSPGPPPPRGCFSLLRGIVGCHNEPEGHRLSLRVEDALRKGSKAQSSNWATKQLCRAKSNMFARPRILMHDKVSRS